jgi:hypothetical protein
LRLPSALLDLKTAQIYCNGDNVSAHLSDDKIILDFVSESEGGGEWEEGLRLSSFLSLRTDLSRGEIFVVLYLAWLSMAKQNKQRTVAELLKEAEYTTQQRQRMQLWKVQSIF